MCDLPEGWKEDMLLMLLIIYYGETRNNAYSVSYTCGGEHRAACRLENEEKPLYKLCQLENGGMQAEFSMSGWKVSSCLVRQVN